MRKASLNVLFAVSVAVSTLIGIAVIVSYVSTSSSRMVRDIEEEALGQTATLMAHASENAIQASVDLAKSLAAQAAIREAFSGSPARAQERLKGYAKEFTGYWSFFLFDAQGRIVAGMNTEGKDLTGGDRLHRDYVQDIIKGKDVAFSASAMKATTGNRLIYVVAKPVRDAAGRLLGGVAVCPLWDDFGRNNIDPIRFGKQGYGFILDAAGRVIAHATDKSLLLKDVSNESFTQKALAAGEGTFHYTWAGKDKYMAVARIPSTGWLVCMTAYDDEVVAPAVTQEAILLGIGAGVLVLITGLVTWMSRLLVLRPLKSLSDFTARVAAGDYKTAMTGHFRAELAAFADNLHEMVEELKKRLGFSQGVLDGIPTPCGIVGPDFNMIWVNAEICRLLEKTGSRESYVGQRSGLFYQNDAGRETLSDRAIKERRPLAAEIDYTSPSGKARRIAVQTTPFYDLDGALLGSISFWLDLTEIHEQKTCIEGQNEVIARAAAEATQVAGRMATATEELLGQIEHANQGASTQSSRVQDTAAAVEEMNATILEVAKNAASTAQSADTARERAREGAALVKDVTAAVEAVHVEASRLTENMRSLGDQARGIGTILDVISDIADQTNLLALNAAIEAARAGDAGRGFAVVADEVRKLAEKTMNATKEVGQAIGGIQQGTADAVSRVDRAVTRVGEATGLAERSGETIGEIVAMVEAAGDQVRSIATAAEQQSATSEEINRAVGEISAIAAETAMAMGQSTQAVEELAAQAQELNRLIVELGGESKAPRSLTA